MSMIGKTLGNSNIASLLGLPLIYMACGLCFVIPGLFITIFLVMIPLGWPVTLGIMALLHLVLLLIYHKAIYKLPRVLISGIGVGFVAIPGVFIWLMFFNTIQGTGLPSSLPKMLMGFILGFSLLQGVSSSVVLIPILRFGFKIYLKGILGFFIGAVLGGLMYAILFGNSRPEYLLFTYLTMLISSAIGGVTLHKALHSAAFRETIV